MPIINFGGGPTLEERRAFAALKPGSHIPGYQGYCPQLKYQSGSTYGNETHVLFKHNAEKSSARSADMFPVIKPNLPVPNGNNKYMKDMVPGYSGYVPFMFSKYGKTYKEMCDDCVSEFITSMDLTSSKNQNLQSIVCGYSRQTPLARNPKVREHMQHFADSSLRRRGTLQDEKRASGEPPIPGYLGYIPRLHTTGVGFGNRYHMASQKGLELFARERQRLNAAMNENGPSDCDTEQPTLLANKTGFCSTFDNRLYKMQGMIPRYTGYLPQMRYRFGKTYGDTSRSLDVCAHKESCFGEYSRKHPIKSSVIC